MNGWKEVFPRGPWGLLDTKTLYSSPHSLWTVRCLLSHWVFNSSGIHICVWCQALTQSLSLHCGPFALLSIIKLCYVYHILSLDVCVLHVVEREKWERQGRGERERQRERERRVGRQCGRWQGKSPSYFQGRQTHFMLIIPTNLTLVALQHLVLVGGITGEVLGAIYNVVSPQLDGLVHLPFSYSLSFSSYRLTGRGHDWLRRHTR